MQESTTARVASSKSFGINKIIGDLTSERREVESNENPQMLLEEKKRLKQFLKISGTK